MARIMWACWDGGGNLTPSLGIARVLETRGHEVHFFGRPDMVHRVEAAGFGATALDHARTDLDRYSFHPMASVFGFTSSPAVGEELVEVAQQWDPDVVVIDAMFASALNVAPRFNRPTAVMLHIFFHHMIDSWRGNFTMQSESRQRAGFDGLPDLDVLWGERDVLHVNALRAFDGQSDTATWPVVHGAPVLAAERRAVEVELPWGTDDQTTIVLLSFSTVPGQRNVVMLQRALDALGPLPVHVVATTGGIVDPEELTATANVYLVPFADHDQLMDRSSMVVGHGSHGTTMRALSHGLPMVGIPAKGADQIPITKLIDHWGAGRALSMDPDVSQIRTAVQEVLGDPSFRHEAGRRSTALAAFDGAAIAADSVETIIPTIG